MKGILFFLISLFIGIFLFLWAISFIGWSEIKLVFQAFTGWEGLVILGLTFGIIVVANCRWREVLKSQGYQVSIFNLLRPFLTSHSINYLVPTIPFSGEVFRGYVLKEKLNLPWKIAISSALIDRILEITSHLIIIFLGVSYFIFKIGLPPKNLAIILGGIFLIATILLSFFYFKSFKKESLVRIFFRRLKQNQILEIEKEVLNFFNFKKFSFWRGLILALFRDIVSLFRSFFLVLFLGKSLGFFSALSILGFSTLITFLPIPAVLGSHEIIQAFVFGTLGLGENTAAAFTTIIRGADLIFALLGIFIIFGFGLSFLKKAIFQERIKKITAKSY